MASETRTIKCSCLCGSVKHEVTLPASSYPLKAFVCHCDSCRHGTGTLCGTVALMPGEYRPSTELMGKLRSFPFSETLSQYHCTTCGAVMLYIRKTADKQTTLLASGTLEMVEGIIDIKAQIHVADTRDGGFSEFLTRINDTAVQRWPHHAGEGEQLPLHWQSSPEKEVTPSPSDRLHAHCKCGGVQLWIARPSARSAMGAAAWPDLIVPANSSKPPPPDDAWWIQVGGKKFLAGLCTCNSCRLASGMEWVEWAFVPTIDITHDAEGKVPFSRGFGTLKGYNSSSGATRYFCETCGAMVFWNGDARPEVIDVAVGLLDAPEGARAESWLEWRSKRVSFREDAIPRAESLTLGLETGLHQYGIRVQGTPVDGGI